MPAMKSALPLFLLLLLPAATLATITLYTTGKQFPSRPAAFGMSFEYGLQYEALLQTVRNDVYLCHGMNDTESTGEGHVTESTTLPTATATGRNASSNDAMIPIVPSNGVPVALLAKRGKCSYETKARVASTLTSPHGAVRFVIVYNNDVQDENALITMMPRHDESGGEGEESYKDLGLLFVSFKSGMDLQTYLTAQPSYILRNGGPRILLDGEDRWFPPGSEPAAGLAMLLMLFGCICSLSLFLSTSALGGGGGAAREEEHVFFLNGRRSRSGGEVPREGVGGGDRRGRRRRGNGLRLLTLEEVETLPTREYSVRSECGDGGGEEEEDGARNSSLELRDKTELPYDEDDRDYEENDDRRQPLCASLSPCKVESYGHNSCSICLDEYRVGEHIRVLPCQHTFHSECIFPWLTERSPTCPLCKAMFEAVKYDEEGQEEDREEDVGGHEEASADLPRPLENEPSIHRGGGSPSDNVNEGGDQRNNDIDREIPSSSLRSRFFGMLGSRTSRSNAPLEEPLLPNDEASMV